MSPRLQERLTRIQSLVKPVRGRLVVLAVAVAVFFGLARAAGSGEHLAAEIHLLQSLRKDDSGLPIGPAWVAEAARDITGLGSMVVLGLGVAVGAGYLALSRRRSSAVALVVASLGAFGLNHGLKELYARERPPVSLRWVEIDSPSFPSGHAMSSAAIYLTLALLLAHPNRSEAERRYLVGAAIALSFLIGLSRIFLGVHYPTDVAAGWAAGGAWALFVTLIARVALSSRSAPKVAARPKK